MTCARCTTPIPAISLAHPERCWYCHAPLCEACWEQYGCCEHPETETINQAFREQRAPHSERDTMDMLRAQQAIAKLNRDFSRLPREVLEQMEDDLGLASGQISARRYTLPGDIQDVRDEVRQEFLDQAAWCQRYLEPEAWYPPAAINTTAEDLTATRLAFLALATQIRR